MGKIGIWNVGLTVQGFGFLQNVGYPENPQERMAITKEVMGTLFGHHVGMI